MIEKTNDHKKPKWLVCFYSNQVATKSMPQMYIVTYKAKKEAKNDICAQNRKQK